VKGSHAAMMGILFWLLYFLASYIVVKFLIRGLLMHNASKPWAQGLAAVTEA
jgi:hypothetical protein